jgi:hypothetical protein
MGQEASEIGGSPIEGSRANLSQLGSTVKSVSNKVKTLKEQKSFTNSPARLS